MKVAFITRSTLYSSPGGDTTQVTATAKYMRRAGLEVDIKLSTDTIDYNLYDLLHFFNIIRPADILKHIRHGRPYVVSTIFVDYTSFDKTQRSGWSGTIFKILPTGFIEYSKAIARYLARNDKLASQEYLWLGHDRSIKKILRSAACLLPNSESEYRRLQAAYGIENKYAVIPNGIDTEVFTSTGEEKDSQMVVCAARIEGIKNQLNLIKALNNSKFKLYLIGDPAPNQVQYYETCRKTAAANIIFINSLPQSELKAHFARAKVHVLPSWFETTGLSSLEAAAIGCSIVIGDKGDAREYFGDHAFYCDPASPASIYKAIERAADAPADPTLQNKIRTKFTWEQAAFMTIQAYKAL